MEGGPPVFPRDSSCPAVLRIQSAHSFFRIRDYHSLRLAFPHHSARTCECVILSKTPVVFLLPVWPLPISLATTLGISVDFFSSPYLDVSVQAVPLIHLWIQCMMHELHSCGLLHSDIFGSKRACHSPKLFAAYRVLHRLLMPRHPPCALISLNSLFAELCLVLIPLGILLP